MLNWVQRSLSCREMALTGRKFVKHAAASVIHLQHEVAMGAFCPANRHAGGGSTRPASANTWRECAGVERHIT
jgi:hypothetical protein